MTEQRRDIVEKDPRFRKIRDSPDVVFEVHEAAAFPTEHLRIIAAALAPQALAYHRGSAYIGAMSRAPIAFIAGIVGFCLYMAAVVVLGDTVQTLHWAIQAVYFVVAGSVWVLPIRWLMFWSVHQR